MHKNRTRSIVSAVCFALAGTVAVGCLEGASGPTEAADAAGPAEGDTTSESQQALTLLCDPTAITPDRSFAVKAETCESNKALSIGDTYADLFCTPYVVEFTYKPLNLAAGWDHDPAGEEECEALRASYTIYTFFNGTWANNGTAKYHGVWADNSPFLPNCSQALDAGSSVPSPGFGTKWRASVSAFAKSCTGESGCYNDYKRVVVSDNTPCPPPS